MGEFFEYLIVGVIFLISTVVTVAFICAAAFVMFMTFSLLVASQYPTLAFVVTFLMFIYFLVTMGYVVSESIHN